MCLKHGLLGLFLLFSLPLPCPLFLYTPFHWLWGFFFLFLSSPHSWLYQSVGCASWDQIRFTLGLNVCSHGILHLKANSFNWNFAVQFETRLMLANFTPPLFQNVSSIGRINCWHTKGICHFVMVMSGLLHRNNSENQKRFSVSPQMFPQIEAFFLIDFTCRKSQNWAVHHYLKYYLWDFFFYFFLFFCFGIKLYFNVHGVIFNFLILSRLLMYIIFER